MNASVLLVRTVPNPLNFNALRPDRETAALADALLKSGATVRVLDLGTLEFVARLLSRDVLAFAPAPEPEDPETPQLDFSARPLSAFYVDLLRHALLRAIAVELPDAVVFTVHSRFELRVARSLASEFCASRAFAESFALFDGELMPLAVRSARVRDSLSAAPTETAHTAAGYAPAIYPALREGSKLHVFEIGHDAASEPSFSGLFMILEETAALARHYGTRAFHFGRSAAGAQVSHLASDLVARDARLQYSVNAAMADYPIELPVALQASGCAAASFLVGSGSQRLIDTHFRYPFRLSLAERTARGCAQAGIHTRIELTYPCADDDFHTREESLRFVRRCMPHAVRVAPPDHARSAASLLWKPIERRRRHLERALERVGVSASITPIDALLASLAGFAGRERQFLHHAARSLVAGDLDALATLVDTINDAARGRSNTIYWRSFGRDQHVVGN